MVDIGQIGGVGGPGEIQPRLPQGPGSTAQPGTNFQEVLANSLKEIEQLQTQADAEILRDGLNDFEKLSPSEQGCFHSKMHPLVHSFHHAWDLHRAGLLGDAEFSAMRDHTASFLMTTGAQQWWAMHKTVPPPEIVSFLDEAVANASGIIEPATERFSWLRSD